MPEITESDISKLVAEVLKRLEDKGGSSCSPSHSVGRGPGGEPCCDSCGPTAGAEDFAYATVDAAFDAAEKSQRVFQELGLATRRRIIDAMRKTSVANAEKLARMAVEETGMGRVADKIQKNLVCAERTPGVEDLQSLSYTGDKGLTLVEYAPFGVVAAVTPSTNPGATIINNSISILSAGNSVVFAPHPASKKTCTEAMRLLNAAVVAAGGPPSLIVTVANITQDTTKAILAHPKGRCNMVTGGPAIVKVAMTVGKTCKTIAAGPGNPPVIVDDTAVFPKCAEDIIFGASFDNNVLCTAEKEVIVLESAKARFLDAMRRDPRAFELDPAQADALTKTVIVEGGRGCKDPKLNREFVGKDAAVLAKAIGVSVPESTRLLWADVPNDHPLVWTEQLMPFLPVTSVKTLDEALELAYYAEGENHHTAAMHSLNVDHLTRMARRMACSIYVKNAPTLFGLGMGEGYATMSIGTPTGDGLTKASHFARPMQCSLVGYFRLA